MFTIHVEMDSGAISRGYDFEEESRLEKALAVVKKQLIEMGIACHLIVDEGGSEIHRERIDVVA